MTAQTAYDWYQKKKAEHKKAEEGKQAAQTGSVPDAAAGASTTAAPTGALASQETPLQNGIGAAAVGTGVTGVYQNSVTGDQAPGQLTASNDPSMTNSAIGNTMLTNPNVAPGNGMPLLPNTMNANTAPVPLQSNAMSSSPIVASNAGQSSMMMPPVTQGTNEQYPQTNAGADAA